MNVHTAYGTVYGIETIEEAQQILDKTNMEREHEDCPECRGMLSLQECIANTRAALDKISAQYEDANGNRIGTPYTAQEIAMVARLDAWAAAQPKQHDPLLDTASILDGENLTLSVNEESEVLIDEAGNEHVACRCIHEASQVDGSHIEGHGDCPYGPNATVAHPDGVIR